MRAGVAVALTAAAGVAVLLGGVQHALAAAIVGLVGLAAWFVLVRVPARERAEEWSVLERDARELASRIGEPLAGGSTRDVAALVRRGTGRIERLNATLSRTAEDVAQLTVVLDCLPDPVFATDSRGVVVVANKAADTFFGGGGGRGPEGRHIEELFTQLDVLEMHRSAAKGEERRTQLRLVRDGVSRVFEVFAAGAMAGEGGGLVLMSLRDVTELATAVQLRTDFVANASHELRTPLAAIKGAAETLESAADDGPMRTRLISMIGQHVGRLEELTRDLLDLSRLESEEVKVRTEEVDPRELAGELSSQFAKVCRDRSLALEFEIAPEVERIRTDGKLLRLILRNLVENACKFAHEETEVRVEASRAEDGGVCWRVIDRGTGIPLDQQARIFERFYQVDVARTGTPTLGSAPTGTQPARGSGLGLSIVRHAVRALGGTIKVESVWGQGTTMVVELPGGE